MTEIHYLASPYSHVDPNIEFKRLVQVSQAAAALTKAGYNIVGPISMSATIAQYGALCDTTFSDWAELDLELIKRLDGVLVLMLDGWKESVGVQAEIVYATELKKPVIYIEPNDVLVGYQNPSFNRFHPAFSAALDEIEKVFEMGAKKHGNLNFLQHDGNKCDHKSMHDSIFHHTAQSYAKVSQDEESKLSPDAHAGCRWIIEIARRKLGLVHPKDKGI